MANERDSRRRPTPTNHRSRVRIREGRRPKFDEIAQIFNLSSSVLSHPQFGWVLRSFPSSRNCIGFWKGNSRNDASWRENGVTYTWANQEPRTKSQKPKAKSQKPKAKGERSTRFFDCYETETTSRRVQSHS